jgi:hypothetical protein
MELESKPRQAEPGSGGGGGGRREENDGGKVGIAEGRKEPYSFLEIAGENAQHGATTGAAAGGRVAGTTAQTKGEGQSGFRALYTYMCVRTRARARARARCENELSGEVIHCSAETNACARAHACVYERAARRPRFRARSACARSAKGTIVT